MSPDLAAYTRMLRRTDELSYRAMIVGMFRYEPPRIVPTATTGSITMADSAPMTKYAGSKKGAKRPGKRKGK